jgi:hypothetical protein
MIMKHLVEFPLADGGSIFVEVSEPEGERGSRRVVRGSEGETEPAPKTFEQALSKIRPATESAIAMLRGLLHKPGEVEMEFGFTLSAEAGVIITSVSTEANYKVTLRWKEEQTADPIT